MKMKIQLKKGVMSEIIGVFILILVITILAGMTFLFTSSLYNTAFTRDKTTSITKSNLNESIASFSNTTGNYVSIFALPDATCRILSINNATNGTVVPTNNYTTSNCLVLADISSDYALTPVNVSYTYTYSIQGTSSDAINRTQIAGATVVNYLPLLFLAIIFGAILAVVLKIILPYINLGNSVQGF
jgi:hypothetical protein